VRYVRAFGRFWFDFIVGEDWRIAAGVAMVLSVGAVLVASGATGGLMMVLAAAAIAAVVVVSVFAAGVGAVRARRRSS
jgi:hypothetical protein